MASVRFLFGVFCFVAIGWGGVFGSGDLAHGKVDVGAAGASGYASGRAGQNGAFSAETVVRIAQGEIGVREVSENAGPRVDAYNAYVGVKKAPWCAAFVSWCFGRAGCGVPRTAWSPALFPKGRQRRQETLSSQAGASRLRRNTPRPVGDISCLTSKGKGLVPVGDISCLTSRKGRASSDDGIGLVFGIYYARLGRIGHCGIVERLDGDWVLGIEGNTNGSGSREGDGVYRKWRHTRTIAKYAHWCDRD